MEFEEKYQFSVCMKTIMFLRWIRIFPTDEELKHPSKRLLSKYSLLMLLGCCFPIGMGINLINNVKSESSKKIFCFITF